MASIYKSGSVETYDDRAGYGYIVPDAPEDSAPRLLVHRRSLRTPTLLLVPGERVLFRTEVVPRGLLAADVHLETPDDPSGAADESIPDYGVVASVNLERSFGFILGDDGARRFFHFSQISGFTGAPTTGQRVSFQTLTAERGLRARDIQPVAAPFDTTPATPSNGEPESVHETAPQKQDNLLALAILARDAKKLDEAAKLYQRGMRESPSVQLITSYAAMEKNRNRRNVALGIYERGLELYPTNLKLFEDAGMTAAAMGEYGKAIELLERGLQLSEHSDESGERLLSLAIARVYGGRGGLADLRKSLDYFKRAKRLFDQKVGRLSFSKNDLLAMNIASIRVQHNRGNLVYGFIQRAKFKVLRAQLLEQITVGADLIVELRNAELTESYGLAGNLFIRCMFKADISLADIESLENTISEWGSGDLVDDQVAILVVASLPASVETLLFRRIEDKRKTAPAIVPVTQAQFESPDDPMTVLRQVLDRWLYRRDLFAQNFPVTGRRFFGRDRPLAQLRDAISSGTAAGIFGLRKVGKTSLLKEIQRRSSDTGDIVIYMDLLSVPADVTEARWLYSRLATELHARARSAQIRGVTWRLGGVHPDYLDIPEIFRSQRRSMRI
jgi:cold shock CspA family protein